MEGTRVPKISRAQQARERWNAIFARTRRYGRAGFLWKVFASGHLRCTRM